MNPELGLKLINGLLSLAEVAQSFNINAQNVLAMQAKAKAENRELSPDELQSLLDEAQSAIDEARKA